jgi:hypothetical protein
MLVSAAYKIADQLKVQFSEAESRFNTLAAKAKGIATKDVDIVGAELRHNLLSKAKVFALVQYLTKRSTKLLPLNR